MKTLSAIFKALSDETRLGMLALLLRHEELCVCDFVEVMGISQSKASRHLRYLLHAGLLEDRRDAVWVHYRIQPRPSAQARDVLRSVAPLLANQPIVELEQRLERWLADKRRSKASCTTPTRARSARASKEAKPAPRRDGRGSARRHRARSKQQEGTRA